MLAVIGTGRESGKTTTVESLIREFTRRGYRVGAIKQIHDYDFTIDIPGKDTWRLAKAGAIAVVAAAPKEVSLIKKVERDRFKEAFKFLRVEKPDMIIVEGDPQIEVPKILAAADPEKAMKRLAHEKVICISSLTPERFRSKKIALKIFHPLDEAAAMTDYAQKHLKKRK